MCRIELRRALLGLLCVLLLGSAQGWAQPRVSLLPGDAALRQATGVASAVRSEFAALGSADIRVYSSTRVREQDLQHLVNSDLIILQMVGRAQFNSIETELRQALARGARV